MSEGSFLYLTVEKWGQFHNMKESSVKSMIFLAKGTHLSHLYAECQLFDEQPTDQQFLWVKEKILPIEPSGSEEIALVHRCLCSLMNSQSMKELTAALERVEVSVGVLTRDFVEWGKAHESLFPKFLRVAIKKRCTHMFGVPNPMLIDFGYVCWLMAKELLEQIDEVVNSGKATVEEGANAKHWVEIGYNACNAHINYRSELVRWYVQDLTSQEESMTWAQNRGINASVIDTWIFRGSPIIGSLARFLLSHFDETKVFIAEVRRLLGEDEAQLVGKNFDSLITLSEQSQLLLEEANQRWNYFLPTSDNMDVDSNEKTEAAAQTLEDYIIVPSSNQMEVDQEGKDRYDTVPSIPVPPEALTEELVNLLTSHGLGGDQPVHDLLLTTLQIATTDQLRDISKEYLEHGIGVVKLKIVPKKKLIKVWESLNTAPTAAVSSNVMSGDLSPVTPNDSTAMIVEAATIRASGNGQAIEDEVTEEDFDPEQRASFAILKQQRNIENTYLGSINDCLTDHAKRFSARALEVLKLSKGEHQQRSRRLGTYMVAARATTSAGAVATPDEGEAQYVEIRRPEKKQRRMKFHKVNIHEQVEPPTNNWAMAYDPTWVMQVPRVRSTGVDYSFLDNEKIPISYAPAPPPSTRSVSTRSSTRTTNTWADDVNNSSHFLAPAPAPAPAPVASSAVTWTCGLCKQAKLADNLTACTSCFTSRPPQPWVCVRCDKKNPANANKCSGCYLMKGKSFVPPSSNNSTSYQSKGNGSKGSNKGPWSGGSQSSSGNQNSSFSYKSTEIKKDVEMLPARGPGHAAPLAMVPKNSINSNTAPASKAKPMMTTVTSNNVRKKGEDVDSAGSEDISARVQRQLKGGGIDSLPPPPTGDPTALAAPPGLVSLPHLAPAPDSDDEGEAMQGEQERQQSQDHDHEDEDYDGMKLMGISAAGLDNGEHVNVHDEGSIVTSLVADGMSLLSSGATFLKSFINLPPADTSISSTDEGNDNEDDGEDDDTDVPHTESMDREGSATTGASGGSGKRKRKKRRPKKNNKNNPATESKSPL